MLKVGEAGGQLQGWGEGGGDHSMLLGEGRGCQGIDLSENSR